MSEMRDLQEDKDLIESRTERDLHIPTINEKIALHAIDRAIAAEKERDKWKAEAENQRLLFNAEYETALRYMRGRDELRKRVEELENQLIGIQVVVDFGIGIGTSDAIKGALQSVKRTVESLFDKQEDTP